MVNVLGMRHCMLCTVTVHRKSLVMCCGRVLQLSPFVSLRKRLNDTMLHMKERIAGKIGNANNNAFKLRKLFAMYDTEKTGMVRSWLHDTV